LLETIGQALRATGIELLDLCFPPTCAACREPRSSSGGPFCLSCARALEPVPPGCQRCGLPGPDRMCGACRTSPPAFDALHAAGLFGGPLADAIHAFKYQDRPALARTLGAWLADQVGIPVGAAIVSVPLGSHRRRARGYDQAALLARALARCARGRLRRRWLQRVRETAPQVGKSREERARNVTGAFHASADVAGMDLVLVDDVVTTGATVRACAEALKSAGARSVTVVSLARAE